MLWAQCYLQLPLQQQACILRPLCDARLQSCKLRHLEASTMAQ